MATARPSTCCTSGRASSSASGPLVMKASSTSDVGTPGGLADDAVVVAAAGVEPVLGAGVGVAHPRHLVLAHGLEDLLVEQAGEALRVGRARPGSRSRCPGVSRGPSGSPLWCTETKARGFRAEGDAGPGAEGHAVVAGAGEHHRRRPPPRARPGRAGDHGEVGRLLGELVGPDGARLVAAVAGVEDDLGAGDGRAVGEHRGAAARRPHPHARRVGPDDGHDDPARGHDDRGPHADQRRRARWSAAAPWSWSGRGRRRDDRRRRRRRPVERRAVGAGRTRPNEESGSEEGGDGDRGGMGAVQSCRPQPPRRTRRENRTLRPERRRVRCSG